MLTSSEIHGGGILGLRKDRAEQRGSTEELMCDGGSLSAREHAQRWNQLVIINLGTRVCKWEALCFGSKEADHVHEVGMMPASVTERDNSRLPPNN